MACYWCGWQCQLCAGASPRRFDGGGRGGFRLEWTDSGESKLSTPKFGFLLEFRPLYFVNIGRSKKLQMLRNFSLKIAISEGHLPRILNRVRVPPVTPLATPIVVRRVCVTLSECCVTSRLGHMVFTTTCMFFVGQGLNTWGKAGPEQEWRYWRRPPSRSGDAWLSGQSSQWLASKNACHGSWLRMRLVNAYAECFCQGVRKWAGDGRVSDSELPCSFVMTGQLDDDHSALWC